ncbi:DUF29 domain-containing protein [Roseofilum capinflatum]|uniref:DUF29 domain-containing protein n=1 Tax=Roseofilum capinflatum BLCC-M114 TaxID=3022440 RepID=A0ABT7B556_9CYAN|nr:DUF29 domain-containing protein [Roseofilum capinflatum]MDJ1173661.1 DUF29 domain-containing protein [Roseofilum capinflatum BLCC-M114]
MTLSPEKVTTLYEIDYLLWIETTLQQLRDRDYNQVDWQNLLEEIEDMGKSERRSIKSNLTVVLMHLLKWEFQPEFRTGSWSGSITQHRTRILYALEDSPSLKNYLPEVLETAYSRARQEASDETQLSLSRFPVSCPYEIEEVLNDGFWPGGDDNIQSLTLD